MSALDRTHAAAARENDRIALLAHTRTLAACERAARAATEVNIFSKPGQPMIPVTYLVHFDSVAQRQLARVPLSVNCSFSGNSPPFYASCLGDFVELELPGRTNSIVTSARPWKAVNYMDDFHLVVYPNEVPKPVRQ